MAPAQGAWSLHRPTCPEGPWCPLTHVLPFTHWCLLSRHLGPQLGASQSWSGGTTYTISPVQ